MSIIQKDVKDSKDRAYEIDDAKVSIRDQIVKKLYKKLEEDKVLAKLSEAWHVSSAEIGGILAKQQVYLDEVDRQSPADAESPFEGYSNLKLPVTFIACKTYHSRFMEALFGIDPPFSILPRREDSVKDSMVARDFLRFTIKDWANRSRGVEEACDMWLWNWINTGTGILKTRWLTEWERFSDVQLVQEPREPKVMTDETGQEILVPQAEWVEKEVTRTVKKYDCPEVDYVNLEDFRMIGGKGDPDAADIVFHRTSVNASDLWTAVDAGKFDEEAVEKVLAGGRRRTSGGVYTNIKDQRAVNNAKSGADSEAELDKYEIIEACFKYDVDGSGINSEVVAWFCTDMALLGATYLRRLMPNGKRPYAVIHFHKRVDQEYGMGLPEIMWPLTKELNMLHNIRIDTGLLTNMPFFFYRPASGMNAETIQFEPGMGIPLDNPQTDIYFPTIGNKTAFSAQEEANIQTYIERLTGLSDLNLGVMSGTQGASRTAAGVRALLGENNTNLDVHLKRLNRGWKKVIENVYCLIRTRSEPGFVFSVTGETGERIFYQVYPDYLPDVDIELAANSSNSNKQVQIETQQQVMQMVLNPLNIQVGISGPAEIYQAQRDYLQLIGVKNVSQYLKKPADDGMNRITIEEEFQRVVRGQNVEPKPGDDHEGFIAFAESMIQAQEKQQTMDNDMIMRLIEQVRKHYRMKAAMDAQAANQAVSNQMAINASAAQAQPAIMSNPMSGSAGLPLTQV